MTLWKAHYTPDRTCLGLSPGKGAWLCNVPLYSHSASLHPDQNWYSVNSMLRVAHPGGQYKLRINWSHDLNCTFCKGVFLSGTGIVYNIIWHASFQVYARLKGAFLWKIPRLDF